MAPPPLLITMSAFPLVSLFFTPYTMNYLVRFHNRPFPIKYVPPPSSPTTSLTRFFPPPSFWSSFQIPSHVPLFPPLVSIFPCSRSFMRLPSPRPSADFMFISPQPDTPLRFQSPSTSPWSSANRAWHIAFLFRNHILPVTSRFFSFIPHASPRYFPIPPPDIRRYAPRPSLGRSIYHLTNPEQVQFDPYGPRNLLTFNF